MSSSLQSRERMLVITHSLTVGIALVGMTSKVSAAVPQSVTYLQQVDTARSPDDVGVTPGAGGIAVIRASEHWYDPINGPQANGDEIVVIKTTDGFQAQLQPGCQAFALTIPNGASDLVAVNSQRAVLIGQHHFGGIESSHVNVLDLTDVYGAGPKCLSGGNWSKSNAGNVSDVALTPDGHYAVVNHKGWISVFEIDGTSVPSPTEFDTQGGVPTFQKNSIAMTQSRGANDPIKCVVVTNRKNGILNRTYAYLLDLSTTTPQFLGSVQINASNPTHDNPPHDVRLTPDERAAVVSAGGVVAVIGTTPDQLTGQIPILGEQVDPAAVRQYDFLSDSLVVTNSQVVALASDVAQQNWTADVIDISTTAPTSFSLKKTETGVGQAHDLARSNDGLTVVVRTTEDIVVIDKINLAASSIVTTLIPSHSGRLSTFETTFDSVIVSRAWVQPLPYPQTGNASFHYAVAIGHDVSQAVPGTRVEIVDLGVTPPAIVYTEVIRDAAWSGGAFPSSIQLRQGGQGFAVRCNAAPHDIDPDSPPIGYDPTTGEDVWFFTLLSPVGSVFQYEMTHSPLALSDPMDLGRTAVVNVSSPYLGDAGHVLTFLVTD